MQLDHLRYLDQLTLQHNSANTGHEQLRGGFREHESDVSAMSVICSAQAIKNPAIADGVNMHCSSDL